MSADESNDAARLISPLGVGAAAAACMADWWSAPQPEDGEWLGDPHVIKTVGGELGISPDLLEPFLASFPDRPASLVEEYERLFIGPGRTPCPPYGAYWRPDRPWHESGSITGESTSRVLGLYAGLGIRIRPQHKEPPDHIAFEWEALGYALGLGHPAAHALLDEHLEVWLPAFCAAVERAARQPFYVALGRLTPAWAEALRRLAETEVPAAAARAGAPPR